MQRRRKLHKARQARVQRIAKVLSQAEPTPFALQAAAVAGIRARLCLKGWPWAAAHWEADQLVKAALDRIGARRPSWAQGQPGYALSDAHKLFVRTRCARCARPLPEGHTRWCCWHCYDAAHTSLYRERQRDQARAAREAAEAAEA